MLIKAVIKNGKVISEIKIRDEINERKDYVNHLLNQLLEIHEKGVTN